MATHFNAAGQANGWMSPDQAIKFGVGFIAFLLVIFTPLLLYMAHSRVDAFSWAMLGFCALVLGLMVEVNRGIVNYNAVRYAHAAGSDPAPDPDRGHLADRDLHSIPARTAAVRPPRIWRLIFWRKKRTPDECSSLMILPALIVPAIVAASVPATALRVSMVLVALIGLVAIAAAWNGFQYRFLRHGVEIRTLGFRLRSIPRQQIQSYEPASWNVLRGYGIRGVGKTRAYVLG